MPVHREKNGSIMGGLDKETLNAYVDYALKMSEQAVNNLKQGVIVPSPYDGACTYCKFKGVCDTENVIERKLNKVTESTIRNSVKGGE
jgi:ATP-dependent helicase/DNAse subunit B